MDSESRVQEALRAPEKKEFKSIYAAAKYFGVDRSTLPRRASGSLSRAQAKVSA